MESIKLIIWDLDETFWEGTLSEEGVVPVKYNIELIKKLSERGVINSIVSKNNFEEAKNKLIELGIWKYFVFPIIDWIPKGKAITDIIKSCQLRDVNVLFIDDNHLNLKEATYYNKKLNVKGPEFIQKIIDHSSFQGKDDYKLTRLNHYKILEKKNNAIKEYGNNLDFLNESEIKIKLIKNNLIDDLDRIYEILERTNQLNYTKIRSNKDEIIKLLSDKKFENGLVHVVDKFGDYGLVGFYSFDLNNRSFFHFSFSCRIINLGIPQYIYSKFNFPKIKVIPNVTEQLNTSKPKWISEIKKTGKIHSFKSNNRLNILFKGGCDLDQMLYYLSNNNFDITKETTYNSTKNYQVHNEHSQTILDSLELSKEKKNKISLTDYIPFVDENYYETKIFTGDFDCIIYSTLMDYTNELYYDKNLDVTLPHGGYYNFWTDSNVHSNLLLDLESQKIQFSKELLSKLSKNFIHKEQITPVNFLDNLTKIRANINKDTPIVFINGADVESNNFNENKSTDRHKIMNDVLKNFINTSSNTYLLDITKVIKSSSQLEGNIRHYNRQSYKNIAQELLSILNVILDAKINNKISKYLIFKKIIILKLRNIISSNKFIHTIFKKLSQIFKTFLKGNAKTEFFN
tara:strand:+ start:908 stop:2791 length:1884 start_codon:yes stop_codon:yes gene_type:complete